MQKDDVVYLGHMLDMARSATEKVRGKSRADFDGDDNLRLALVHLIQVIGEAARQVTEPTRQQYPEIPWKDIVGMRHRVVHDYMHVDFDVVWEVAAADLPGLVKALEKIVCE